MNPLLLTDFYKVHHNRMYPEGMTKLYSNLTPRKSRMPGVDRVVVFGIQHFALEYLIKKFNKDFFEDYSETHPIAGKKVQVIEEYKRHINVDTSHMEKLWDLGYLPIEIKALPEGTLCPIGVPMLTITNTHPDFAWLVNYLETLLSASLWQAMTSATIAYEFRKILNHYAKETTGSTEGVQWQGHDFSMRGHNSVESAILSGMGHLLSFTGTDTIPAIYQLEDSYYAEGLIGASVPATEHSVMCMGQKESEIDTFKRLLNLYPTGILSVVSDTWDLWKVIIEYLPAIKTEIMGRDGKLVIRPDSGDPVDIICGEYSVEVGLNEDGSQWSIEYGDKSTVQGKGVIELLWDIFGGTVNEQGYKVLDSHIGAIYGDSITIERAKEICERLKAKGFASTNIVLGIGSMTYVGGETTPGKQYWITRDLFGFAMKATYGEITTTECQECTDHERSCNNSCIECREIFKDPITDDGTKRSKKGLLLVGWEETQGEIMCVDQVTWEHEQTGLLETVFKDSKLMKKQTLSEIRERLNNQ